MTVLYHFLVSILRFDFATDKLPFILLFQTELSYQLAFAPFNLSIADLSDIKRAIYRLQSNSYQITFQMPTPKGRHLKCDLV